MVLETVSLVHHHVVPLDVVQDGGVLQDQLICGDDDLHAPQHYGCLHQLCLL